MSVNAPVLDLGCYALPIVDMSKLDSVIGGDAQEGWGHWAGRYVGAAVGGGLAAGLATPLNAVPVVGQALYGGTVCLGGAVGYDYGGRLGNWLTGGR